ncbi:hypothetical protein T492DRAFT_851472, partial [Pavlovales sp. CCMP2436]
MALVAGCDFTAEMSDVTVGGMAVEGVSTARTPQSAMGSRRWQQAMGSPRRSAFKRAREWATPPGQNCKIGYQEEGWNSAEQRRPIGWTLLQSAHDQLYHPQPQHGHEPERRGAAAAAQLVALLSLPLGLELCPRASLAPPALLKYCGRLDRPRLGAQAPRRKWEAGEHGRSPLAV